MRVPLGRYWRLLQHYLAVHRGAPGLLLGTVSLRRRQPGSASPARCLLLPTTTAGRRPDNRKATVA